MKKMKSCKTLQLSKTEDYNELIDLFGGQKQVEKYDEIIKMIERAKKEEPSYTLLETPEKTTEPYKNLEDAVYFPSIHYDKTKKLLTVYYAASYVTLPSCMYLIIKVLRHDGLLLATENIDPPKALSFLSGKIEFKDIPSLDSYQISITGIVSTPKNALKVTILNETLIHYINGKAPFIERANVSAPKKNNDTDNQPLEDNPAQIRAFYNRYPFRLTEVDVDYVYIGAYDPQTQMVKVNLDGGGNILLDKNYPTASFEIGSDIAIMDFHQGAVKYRGQNSGLSIKGNKLFWVFKKDWNSVISASYYHAITNTDITYKLGFYQNINPSEDILYVSSLIEKDMDCSCRKIRQLLVQIGCVLKGTQVSLANGKSVPIEEIKIGETLLGLDGQNGIVSNIWKGEEAQLYCLHTEDDHVLYLTATHSIQTNKGIVMAKDLNLGMKVYMGDKSYQFIKYLYVLEQECEVYNLSVQGNPGVMICEGMVLMDNDYRPIKEEVPCNENNTLLAQQLRKLFAEIK